MAGASRKGHSPSQTIAGGTVSEVRKYGRPFHDTTATSAACSSSENGNAGARRGRSDWPWATEIGPFVEATMRR
jgi:hypothetical protein